MNSLFRILPNQHNNLSNGDKINKTDNLTNLTIGQTDNITKKDKNIKDIKEIKYWEYGNSG